MEVQVFNNKWDESYGYLNIIDFNDVSHMHILDQEKAMIKFKTGLFYHINTTEGHGLIKWIDQQKNRNMMEIV